ncbi:hypothetical protein LAZ67_21001865 [Cordylochernes scorpioides]|uniref:Vesicle-associated membrane protein 7 n=1 Tax=Cordylochernes scorpioides TaxID=51811 RepID=A0ABY6LMD3_9ARAC|nr:hypothetical protein LAZ67_21001865 [Cordylochernes scorpioides]
MDEGILYGAIARGNILLTSAFRTQEDFESTAHFLIDKIPTTANTKTSYTDREYTYHVLVENGVTYLCSAYTNYGKRVPYAFLTEVQKKFESGSLVARSLHAREHEFDRDFSNVLAELMEKFSRGQGSTDDHVGKLKNQIDDVMGIMTQNIEKVMERGDRLEVLIDKTEDLEQSSSQFQTSSKRLRRKMCYQNIKMWIFIGIIAAIVITLIVLFATGIL